MRDVFVNTLIENGRKDERVFLITADLGYSVLEKFRDEFPDRFINVGIAEQNAIGVATGLALAGNVPYIYSIIPFITMRCFEQVRLAAYMGVNIRIIGVGAGFSYGPAGTTHHAIEDIAIMRALPNMTVCCPGDPVEAKALIESSFSYSGPMYFRLGNNCDTKIYSSGKDITLGKGIWLEKGNDLAIVTTSTMLQHAYIWADYLKKQGKEISIVSIPTMKPFDEEIIRDIISHNMPIITLEEHNIIGGLGSAVAEIIAESGKGVKFKRIAIPDQYSHYVGSHELQKKRHGLLYTEVFENFLSK